MTPVFEKLRSSAAYPDIRPGTSPRVRVKLRFLRSDQGPFARRRLWGLSAAGWLRELRLPSLLRQEKPLGACQPQGD